MRKILTVVAAMIGFTLVSFDADAARRMGGGKNIGKQREAIQQPAKPPAQQQAAPNSATAQPQPSGASRWLGPLAGLAIGAGLASLFMNNGLAGAFGGLLLLAVIVALGVFLFRMFRGGTRPGTRPMEYAGAGAGDTNLPRTEPRYTGGGAAAPHSVAAATGGATPATTQWPAGFDADQFVRNAKRNFISLQTAHDARDFENLRDLLTPEVLREVEADARVAGGAPQHTEVVTLDAEVLNVVEEQGLYIVSVRGTGTLHRQRSVHGPDA
jgi:predicted lipid-binding transport protein (Tim44 family)